MFAVGYFGSTKDPWVGSHEMFYNNLSYLQMVIVLVAFKVWAHFSETLYNLIFYHLKFHFILKTLINTMDRNFM